MESLATRFPVTVKDLFKIALLTIFLLFLSDALLSWVQFEARFKDFPHRSVITLFVYFLQSISMLIPVYIFVLRKHRLRLADLGVRKVGIGKTIKLILSSFGIFFLFNIIMSLVMEVINKKLPGFGPQDEHISLFGTQVIDIMIAVLIVGVIAPIVEELIFRGFLLQTLMSYLSPFWASLITATIFGLIHFEFQTIAILIFLGLLLNRLYVKSNSIIPGIIFHMINNVLAFWLEFIR